MSDPPLSQKNTSKIFYNGRVMTMLDGEQVTIVGKTLPKNKKPNTSDYCQYIVKFSDGSKQSFRGARLKKGNCYSKYKKTIYNVGFIGEGKYSPTNSPKEYNTWRCMFQRCYDKKYLKRFPTYVGCSVDERWRNFQTFCEDIPYLEGYEEWIDCASREYHLDKDLKIIGNKVYCVEACSFQKAAINIGSAHLTGETFVGVRLSDGYKEEFTNMNAWAKDHNMDDGNVGKSLHMKNRTVKGWKIYYKGEEIDVEL